MKIKTIIVALGLVITMISGGMKSNYFNTATNETVNFNTVLNEEVVIEDENVISEIEEQNKMKQEEITSNEVEEIPEKEVIQEEIIQKQQEVPKTSTSSQAKPVIKNETVMQNTQEIEQKQEQNTGVVETPKEETHTTAPVTQSDLEYWCVAGGSHHVAGDGANEHGYYASWDEANQAFENYTSGWSSVEYKISQCPCGLFYFWAIQSN